MTNIAVRSWKRLMMCQPTSFDVIHQVSVWSHPESIFYIYWNTQYWLCKIIHKNYILPNIWKVKLTTKYIFPLACLTRTRICRDITRTWQWIHQWIGLLLWNSGRESKQHLSLSEWRYNYIEHFFDRYYVRTNKRGHYGFLSTKLCLIPFKFSHALNLKEIFPLLELQY